MTVESEATVSKEIAGGSEQAELQGERMIPQSDVNRIVGQAREDGKRGAYEKGYQEAANKFAAEKTASAPESSSVDIEARVNDLVDKREKEYQQQYAGYVQQQEDEKIRDDLVQKINESKGHYEDFDAVVNNEFLEGNDAVLRAVNEVPNSGHVLYHLGNNLLKVGSLKNLTPTQMKAAIRKLSKSLAANQVASSTNLAADPLQQTKPGAHSAKARKIDNISWKC